MNALERLDDFLLQVVDTPVDTEEVQKFRIDTKEQAMWAMRKIATIERERKEAQDAAQVEIERIQTWLAGEEKRANQARLYLDFLLEDYHRRILAENKKQKTIKLPHGQLQLRAQQPEFQKDEDVIKTWAQKNRPEFIITPPAPESKLDWAKLKKALKVVNGQAVDPTTSEIIPGITVIERDLNFQVKLSGV